MIGTGTAKEEIGTAGGTTTEPVLRAYLPAVTHTRVAADSLFGRFAQTTGSRASPALTCGYVLDSAAGMDGVAGRALTTTRPATP